MRSIKGVAAEWITDTPIEGEAMKPAGSTFKTFLATNTQFVCADLFTIYLLNGDILYFTSADIDIAWGGNTYLSNVVLIDGLRYKVSIGLDVDEQTITVSCDRTVLYAGIPVMDAIRGGSLDGARIHRDRVYAADWVTAPVGAISLFVGYVSTIDNLTRMSADIKVKSELALLDVEMPRRKYQAGCLNTLFDGGCKLVKATYTTAGTTGAGSTKSIVNWTGATLDYFSLGTIKFTSGANNNEIRTIKISNGTQLILSYPLIVAPSAGDTFNAVAGCDKTLTICNSKFSNTANFAGFPFIPAAEKAF